MMVPCCEPRASQVSGVYGANLHASSSDDDDAQLVWYSTHAATEDECDQHARAFGALVHGIATKIG